eukprot:1158212-Pelagomonas_calceolata.AAC.9
MCTKASTSEASRPSSSSAAAQLGSSSASSAAACPDPPSTVADKSAHASCNLVPVEGSKGGPAELQAPSGAAEKPPGPRPAVKACLWCGASGKRLKCCSGCSLGPDSASLASALKMCMLVKQTRPLQAPGTALVITNFISVLLWMPLLGPRSGSAPELHQHTFVDALAGSGAREVHQRVLVTLQSSCGPFQLADEPTALHSTNCIEMYCLTMV